MDVVWASLWLFTLLNVVAVAALSLVWLERKLRGRMQDEGSIEGLEFYDPEG